MYQLTNSKINMTWIKLDEGKQIYNISRQLFAPLFIVYCDL